MVEKKPSSLDYASLLHELTLKNWMASIVQNEWRRAEIAAEKLSKSHDRFWAWLGAYDMAVTRLCRGKPQRALESLTVACQVYLEAPHLVASALIMTSHVLNEMGQPTRAMASAKQAVGLCRGDPLAREALFFCGQSKLRQGRFADAEKIAEQLTERLPTTRGGESRARYLQLRGEIALGRGDTSSAIGELKKAVDILKDLAPMDSPGDLRIPIRFSSASASLKSKHRESAVRELEEIVGNKRALLNWPIPYVRSFFLLGRAYQGLGEINQAAKYLERFLDFWKEGQLDSDTVKEAEELLSTFTPR